MNGHEWRRILNCASLIYAHTHTHTNRPLSIITYVKRFISYITIITQARICKKILIAVDNAVAVLPIVVYLSTNNIIIIIVCRMSFSVSVRV